MNITHRSFRLPMTPLAACLAIALTLPTSMTVAGDREPSTAIPNKWSAKADADRFFGNRLPRYALPNTLPKTGRSPNRPATTLTVDNCDDAGTGSLRATVAAAVNGDIINFSPTLTCSTITLTTGAITVGIPASNLTVAGPGAGLLTIDGNLGGGAPFHRVFIHRGTGTLSLQGLTITSGKYQSPSSSSGGCIYSDGSVTLTESTISGCSIVTNSAAKGGAIYAKGNVTLIRSTVTGNVASSIVAGYADGGGVFANQGISAQDSTINNNEVLSVMAFGARGGGLFSGGIGNVTITNSTISLNHAKTGAGLFVQSGIGMYTTAINNSTISGNEATATAGGVFSNASLTRLSNSTIVFNSGAGPGAGVYGLASLQLQSSIIAGNRTPSWDPSDLASPAPVMSGANNLITSSTVTLPLGTLTACPKLGPLANNGGPTQTHALLNNTGAVSPAIDSGNNMSTFVYDQRSMGYPRTYALTMADIGAYEWQGETSDRMFVDRFESVCN